MEQEKLHRRSFVQGKGTSRRFQVQQRSWNLRSMR